MQGNLFFMYYEEYGDNFKNLVLTALLKHWFQEYKIIKYDPSNDIFQIEIIVFYMNMNLRALSA